MKALSYRIDDSLSVLLCEKQCIRFGASTDQIYVLYNTVVETIKRQPIGLSDDHMRE